MTSSNAMTAKKVKATSKMGDKKEKRKRAKKDPDAPKRALSAYMWFAQDKRLDITKKDPSLQKDVAKVSKIIGEMWSKATEKEKQPYEKKAAGDKARYEREKAAYVKKK